MEIYASRNAGVRGDSLENQMLCQLGLDFWETVQSGANARVDKRTGRD